MSRDAHHTHLHLHHPHHADLFEEFCRPPSLPSSSATSHQQNQTAAGPTLTLPHLHSQPHSSDPSAAAAGMVSLPGHYLPFEEIPLRPELMPLNPEDEDGVVPDMHAAFGILRALGPEGGGGGEGGQGMGQGEESRAGVMRGEGVWRDLGMEGVLEGGGGGGLVSGNGNMGRGVGGGAGGTVRLSGAMLGGRGERGGLRREGQRKGVRGLR